MHLEPATDQKVRQFARQLDYANGEDAYHNVIVRLLDRPVQGIQSLETYLKGCTKLALWSIYKNETEEQRARGYKLLNWHPSDRYAQETCKRGHALIKRPRNKQKICLECKRLRESKVRL